MLQYYDINCKPVITLLYLLTIQLMVYNRTITRFIADDKVAYQRVRWEIWLASDNSWARHRLKHVSWRSRWIIFFVYTWIENSSFMWNLTMWPMPFWLVLLTEDKVLHCYVPNTVYRCLVAGQLYPSFGLSLADCRCFQVSNPCGSINVPVHHTALTDKDFLIRIAYSCEIFMILSNFCWYLGLDNFPR